MIIQLHLIIKRHFSKCYSKIYYCYASKISTGASYNSEKLLLVANYSSQNWSDYQFLIDGVSVEEDNLKIHCVILEVFNLHQIIMLIINIGRKYNIE